MWKVAWSEGPQDLQFLLFCSALQPPLVVGGSLQATSGQPLTLACNYSVPPNLATPPTMQWVHSNGTVLSNNADLTFDPLKTSHGGEYSCSATVSISQLDITLRGSSTTQLTVQSEWALWDWVLIRTGIMMRMSYHSHPLPSTSHTVPTPLVTVVPVGKPYNGTTHTLTCTATVDASVDTNITIPSQWTASSVNNLSSIPTISSSSAGQRRAHQTNLTFRPLRSEDEQQYTCSVEVSSSSSFVLGSTGGGNGSVAVLSELMGGYILYVSWQYWDC